MREEFNTMQIPATEGDDSSSFSFFAEQFADMRILRYRLTGFHDLGFKERLFIYYLSQAALAGRDILWDQNFRYNLRIRKTLECVFETYCGERETKDFMEFLVYMKRVMFANGIHHHYSGDKMIPGFSRDYFRELVSGSDIHLLPLSGNETAAVFLEWIVPVIFDEDRYARKLEQREGYDIVSASSSNFYSGVSRKEAEDFYAAMTDPSDPAPVSYGLNSRLVKHGEKVFEEVYRSGGKYGTAIDKIICWLEKAAVAAPNEDQGKELLLLIDYYRSGDLRKWDEYSLAWVRSTNVLVDYNNGFIETYDDPLGMKASWEAIVNYADTEATKRSALITTNAQWFEDNSPVPAKYRKEKVTGISAKVVNISMLGGACYPASPLGINLPNSDWIRKEAGSKSVRLSNITEAYDVTARGNGFLEEFAENVQEVERVKKYGSIADAIHTDLHECIGHASGKLAEGTDPNALKNYASALEETRADLVALYFIMDNRMLELGLLPSAEAAMAAYDSYLRNGLITQLTRIAPGKVIEQAHMRCRSLISHWVFEKAEESGAIIKTKRASKTFVRINDYSKVRILFGKLLHEVQRIKSEGDYRAGKALVDRYGISVDATLHNEVLSRYAKLNLAPYTGFINPSIMPVISNTGNISDIVMNYNDDYIGQMMYYGKEYSFLDYEN